MLDALKKLMIDSPILALGVIFWIGAVASLSSCTAVRLPIVLGYVVAGGDSRKRSMLLTGLFLAGLVTSYVLIGAAVAYVGGAVSQLLHASKAIFWFSGALLIVTGVLISGMISPGLLPSRWQHIGARLDRARSVGAAVFGGLFGLLTMPACPLCGAGLIVLAGLVAAEGFSLYGLAMFASFALGQAVPVMAVGVLTTVLRPGLIRRLRTRLCSTEQHVQLLCGNLLIVLGIYYIVVG
ncbi:MAG: sulfite exporter TauE/SafE family protein [Sedimentisphaerales bacterium]|nr:sulfite exporter TauE/SafE family protein [Sedimentisphaerales bacterium]